MCFWAGGDILKLRKCEASTKTRDQPRVFKLRPGVCYYVCMLQPQIKPLTAGLDGKYAFDVGLEGGHSYKVTVSEDYYHGLTGGHGTMQDLIKKSFEFLLEREGPGSILPEFDLSIISTYFPEYEQEVRAYFSD